MRPYSCYQVDTVQETRNIESYLIFIVCTLDLSLQQQHYSNDRSCIRGMFQSQIHLICQCCPRASIPLQWPETPFISFLCTAALYIYTLFSDLLFNLKLKCSRHEWRSSKYCSLSVLDWLFYLFLFSISACLRISWKLNQIPRSVTRNVIYCVRHVCYMSKDARYMFTNIHNTI